MSIPLSTTPKRGRSCLGGCLVMLIVLFLAGGFLVAKYGGPVKKFLIELKNDPERTLVMAVFKTNPNLELVGENKARREITFKVKGQTETYTVNLDELRASEGKTLRLKTSKGEIIEIDSKGLVTATSLPTTGTEPGPTAAPKSPN